ncbi:calcium load-activated calcium channel isoform X2 [Gallus gallus]|nr:calcium load-activated calcium channel isoform X2 [Gallus gallus]
MAFPLRITPLLHRQAENTSFPVFCFPLQIIGSRACHKALFIRLAESKVLSTTNDKSAVVISAKIVLRLLGWQLEKKKETITESAGRQQKKKIERQEEKLKNNNRDLSMVRMKSMFAIGFCFTALMGMFNSIFDGRVVAKLPFIPLSYIQGLSHRNLLGEDYTDCSFIFLYILCTMSIRQNIQKMLGLAPSRAATKQAGGFLGPPPQAGKFS